MTRRTLALAFCALVLLLAAACGGDDAPSATPEPQLNGIAVLRIDLAAAGGAASTSAVADVLAARLNALGIPASAVETSPGTLQVAFESDRTEDELTAVLSSDIGFREPVLDDDGDVVCAADGGGEVAVNALAIALVAAGDGQLFAECYDAEGARVGQVTWKQATGVAGGQTLPLSGARVLPDAGGPTTDAARNPAIDLSFDAVGAPLLADITRRLVGYPLAIFLGGRLLAAPLVNAQVPSGQVAISGITARQVELLAAIVRSGPLPAPVSVLSIELQ